MFSTVNKWHNWRLQCTIGKHFECVFWGKNIEEQTLSVKHLKHMKHLKRLLYLLYIVSTFSKFAMRCGHPFLDAVWVLGATLHCFWGDVAFRVCLPCLSCLQLCRSVGFSEHFRSSCQSSVVVSVLCLHFSSPPIGLLCRHFASICVRTQLSPGWSHRSRCGLALGGLGGVG